MDLPLDSTLGPYRIIRPLGRGGMGGVYEVEHVELGVHRALNLARLSTFDCDFNFFLGITPLFSACHASLCG